ncbi:MAG: ParA family protein [Candidatus Hydrothermia bacterium]
MTGGKIIAISNQKGGVGKTTTCTNLAAALGLHEKKVLVIDMDPQANTSSSLRFPDAEVTIYDVLLNKVSVREAIKKTEEDNVWIIPSNKSLVGGETEFREIEEWQFLLKRALEQVDGFDYVLIDTPPSLGTLTIMSLVAADSILVPVQCEYYALEGLTQLMKTIVLVRNSYNPKLKIEGLLLTMYDKRLNLSRQIEEEVRRHFGRKVFNTVIYRSIRLAEAPSFGLSIVKYAPDSLGASNYMDLARELMYEESIG